MTVKSLREFAFDSLRAFLYGEGFSRSPNLIAGVAYLANHICQYQEESVRLRPELLITTDLIAVAKTLPTHIWLPIDEGPLTLDTFKRALKACAPLAQENWIVCFEIRDEIVSYGVLTSGMSEPNPSPYFHLKVGFSDLAPLVIYLKALGPTLLLVKGKNEEFKISFSLEEFEEERTDHFTVLADHITRKVDEPFRRMVADLFVGLLEQAAESSHGCLIAVLGDDVSAETKFRSQITNGIFIPEPIDIARYAIEAQQTRDSNLQMSLASICGVVKRMISHDGVTLFSCDGRLLGYNLFVPSNDARTSSTIGGARSRAFRSLSAMPMVSCVGFRSQDGAMKTHLRGASE
jgi:hypothetical protein